MLIASKKYTHRHSRTNAWPNIWEPHDQVKLTYKIRHCNHIPIAIGTTWEWSHCIHLLYFLTVFHKLNCIVDIDFDGKLEARTDITSPTKPDHWPFGKENAPAGHLHCAQHPVKCLRISCWPLGIHITWSIDPSMQKVTYLSILPLNNNYSNNWHNYLGRIHSS